MVFLLLLFAQMHLIRGGLGLGGLTHPNPPNPPNPPPPRCYPRDHFGHHESFCLLTLCRGPTTPWQIPSLEYAALVRADEETILERVWNIGNVEVIDSTQLPHTTSTASNSVVLINNVNHGSAHFALSFLFPALSVVDTLNLTVIGIRHRLSHFVTHSSTIPWVDDVLPVLPALFNLQHPHSFNSPAPPIDSNAGFYHPQPSCFRSLLLHEVDMRGGYQSIEILPPHASRLPTVTSMNTILADHALVQTLEQLAATRGIDDPATLAAIYAATSR